MKTRLALARSVLHEPDLLLFDEPTSGLDPESSHAVLEMIREMTGDGRTVVMCTHLLLEAEGLAEQVIVLEAGDDLVSGTPRRADPPVLARTPLVRLDAEDPAALDSAHGTCPACATFTAPASPARRRARRRAPASPDLVAALDRRPASGSPGSSRCKPDTRGPLLRRAHAAADMSEARPVRPRRRRARPTASGVSMLMNWSRVRTVARTDLQAAASSRRTSGCRW